MIEICKSRRLQKRLVVAVLVEEVSIFVVDPGQTAGHARAEVDAGGAEDDGQAARHVFAAVIAHAFDDGKSAGVAHREALACATGGKEPAAGCAVERDVAEQSMFFALEGDASAPADNQFAAAEPFADEIVRQAFELSVMPVTANAPNDWPAVPFMIEGQVRAGRGRVVCVRKSAI